MTPSRLFVFFLGMALGLGQGSLAFAFQVAITGSVTGYLITMVSWCAGSALGLWRTRAPGSWGWALAGLLASMLAGSALMYSLQAGAAGMAGGALATVAAGFFAGRLLALCDVGGVAPGELMAFENTGFILAFCATVVGLLWYGLGFLFVLVAGVWVAAAWTRPRQPRVEAGATVDAPPGTDPAADVHAAAAAAAGLPSHAFVLPRPQRPRHYGIALALAVGCFLLYTCCAWPGYWQWDGLMTATAVHDYTATPWSVIFYFAHTLVIPITWALHLLNPTGDALVTTALRENLCAGANVGLLYLFLVTLLRRERPAMLLAVAWILCEGHWRLASGGEEKDFMLLVGMPYLLGLYQLMGWLDLGFPFRMRAPDVATAGADLAAAARRRRYWRAAWLGVFLAFANVNHLESGLLVFMTFLVFLLRPRTWTHAREELTVLAWIMGVGGVLTAGWYAFVMFGVNGFTTLEQCKNWLFEYHYSGEFEKKDPGVTVAYRGLRGYLIGAERLPAGDDQYTREAIVACALFALLAVRALRYAPFVVGPALVLIALKAWHFWGFLPDFPESWGGVAFVGLIVVGAGAFTAKHQDARRASMVVASVLLALLACVNLQEYRDRAERYEWMSRLYRADREEVTSPVAAAIQRHQPLENLVRYSSRFMASGAVVFVDWRHLPNYFWVYTDLVPINRDYFDRPPAEVDAEESLSVLSERYYLPRYDAAALVAEMRGGRRAFVLTESRAPHKRLLEVLGANSRLVREVGYDAWRNWRIHELVLRE